MKVFVAFVKLLDRSLPDAFADRSKVSDAPMSCRTVFLTADSSSFAF